MSESEKDELIDAQKQVIGKLLQKKKAMKLD